TSQDTKSSLNVKDKQGEKTGPSGNDQSHVTLKTEVSVEQDDDMIPEESLDENQIIEQCLIHELCSSISSENNVSSTEIISSCISLENMISVSAQHLSYLFETAIKSSQQEILDWHNYSFEFESKADALATDETKVNIPTESYVSPKNNPKINSPKLYSLKKMLSKEKRKEVINKLTMHFTDSPKVDLYFSVDKEGEHQTDTYWIFGSHCSLCRENHMSLEDPGIPFDEVLEAYPENSKLIQELKT
ncbi:2562_t:CDS:2, partial [Ambispora gerdemannii]